MMELEIRTGQELGMVMHPCLEDLGNLIAHLTPLQDLHRCFQLLINLCQGHHWRNSFSNFHD